MSWTADRKSTRLNSSHPSISYAVFCLKKKKPQALPRRHIQRNHNHTHQQSPQLDGGAAAVRSADRRCVNTLAGRALAFFFNDTATTEIYTLSLHDALPI